MYQVKYPSERYEFIMTDLKKLSNYTHNACRLVDNRSIDDVVNHTSVQFKDITIVSAERSDNSMAIIIVIPEGVSINLAVSGTKDSVICHLAMNIICSFLMIYSDLGTNKPDRAYQTAEDVISNLADNIWGEDNPYSPSGAFFNEPIKKATKLEKATDRILKTSEQVTEADKIKANIDSSYTVQEVLSKSMGNDN